MFSAASVRKRKQKVKKDSSIIQRPLTNSNSYSKASK
jgi:hypothetical protein